MSKSLFLITGGSGFIGSNLVKLLNQKGYENLVIIDNYNEVKFRNIKSLKFIDFITYTKGIEYISKEVGKILSKGYKLDAIFHIGANADVLVKDSEVMFEANFEHSKYYLELSEKQNCPLIYASSSAVYGNIRNSFIENSSEDPHNIYAWSKLMFDRIVQKRIEENNTNRIIGLRLFNVFGIGEYHKGKNASIPYRFFDLIRQNGFIDLFEEHIERDYVWVEDVVNVFYEAYLNQDISSGLYNLGNGNPISHENLANFIAAEFYKKGIFDRNVTLIKKIPMPDDLKCSFQFYTKAENIEPWVKNHANKNEQKIQLYIQKLIEKYYGNL